MPAVTGNPMADLYIAEDERVRPLYPYGLNERDIAARAHELDRRFAEAGQAAHVQREALVAALERYAQEVTGLTAGRHSLLDKLRDPRALTVVTGQQAGLFTGPLYTVYKAISTAAWAAHYERLLARPVVPIFWVASEDHDFEEVASAYYVSRDGTLEKAALRHRPAARAPVGYHAINDGEYRHILERLALRLPQGVHTRDLLQQLDAAHRHTANMADLFARLLGEWLKDVPLLLVNPLRPDLRALAAPAFAAVLAEADRFRDAAVAGDERVRQLGIIPQVEVNPRHSLLYVIEDGVRSALDISPDARDAFVLRDRGTTFTKADLLARLQTRPETFSAGALYRPVVQDHLLPVLAYVGGAAEIAYHGMMKDIFAASLRTMPPLLLRMRAVALPKQAVAALRRVGFGYEEARAEDFERRLLATAMTQPVTQVVEQLVGSWRRDLHERADYFTALAPSCARAVGKADAGLEEVGRRLTRRAERAALRGRQEFAGALAAAQSWCQPRGTEQERVLSPLSLIAEYGTQWIEQMVEYGCSQDICRFEL
jgi:bacillithiol biosynthesis cysteine-adding enzyme BshC